MSRNPGRAAVAVSIVIFLVFAFASPARSGAEDPAVSRLFAAAFLPIYWIAALLAWQVSRTAELDNARKRAWELIAFANVVFAVNNGLFFAHRHFGLFPENGAVVFVVVPLFWYAAMFAALAQMPRAMSTSLERATFWLDATTVFVSGLLILFYVFAHTPGRSSAESPVMALLTIAFPALDAALIFTAIIVILRPAHGVSRAAVGLLGASAALMMIANLAYGRAAAIGAHYPNIWYEPIYLLASVIAVVAAQMQQERPGSAGPRQFEIASTTSSVIPYAAVVGAVLTVIFEVGGEWNTALGRLVLGAVVMTGLVMARQLISRRHIKILAEREQARRTREAALEAQLQQSQKLEAIGLLAGGVAHDFNNILTAIRASAEMSAASGPTEHREDMQEIVRAVKHGASLTRQLLAFGRRDAVQLQRFDMRDVVHHMDSMLRRVVAGEIVLRISLPSSSVPVEIDRGQMEQVLLNLAINARDAMPEGGALDIQVGTTTIETTTPVLSSGRYAKLVVADTGHGMSQDVMSHIFEPFYTTKPRGRGSGLGLSTVFAIVSRAGGAINVSSEVGLGTRFEVLIPLADSPEMELDAEARTVTFDDSAKLTTGREVVLVVDDEASIRNLVSRYLTRSGYVVITEAGAAEALARLTSGQRIDLLLTDLTMPGMSGRALLERARAIDPELRVICMSGYAERDDSVRGEDVRMANYIEKPFSLSTLGRLVRSTLDTPGS